MLVLLSTSNFLLFRDLSFKGHQKRKKDALLHEIVSCINYIENIWRVWKRQERIPAMILVDIIKLIVHIYRLLHSLRFNTFPDRDKQ